MTSIYDVLWKLGICSKYKGYRYLAAAVKELIEDEDYSDKVTQLLYPKIAEQFNEKNWPNVMKDIRTVTMKCWCTRKEYLDTLAGRTLTEVPAPLEMIELIAGYIVREEREKKADKITGRNKMNTILQTCQDICLHI